MIVQVGFSNESVINKISIIIMMIQCGINFSITVQILMNV